MRIKRANQPITLSPLIGPEVKNLKAFAIWPQYCTGRSYLGTKLLDKLFLFSNL